MENNKIVSGFKINSIILVESCFSRINNVEFGENITRNFNIDVQLSINEQTITVAEEVIVEHKFKDIEQVKIKVRMVGIFEVNGNPSVKNLEEFGKINGAAIIFPYIREHITNLSLKAGISPIFLPPADFTKLRNKD
ncbi:MAG: protein-export chaperone SecB [Bacteroidales bacterium]|jgi:preprotein translocase subunit SecB|nr:protein-export chaperone SecB [Bacteroidales bacterium]